MVTRMPVLLLFFSLAGSYTVSFLFFIGQSDGNLTLCESVFDWRRAAIGQQEGHCDGTQRHNQRRDQQYICRFCPSLLTYACMFAWRFHRNQTHSVARMKIGMKLFILITYMTLEFLT